MTPISVQASVYALGATDMSAAIAAFLRVLDAHGLRYEVGIMSTVVWGEENMVWRALREGYADAASLGPVVMQVTISNACPLSDATRGRV